MGRGIFAGVLWGGLASVLSLGLASLVADPPPGATPPEAPQSTAPAEPAGAEEAAAPDRPATSGDAAPPGEVARAPSAPDARSDGPVGETEPPPRPASSADEPAAPESPAVPDSPAELPEAEADPAPARASAAAPEEPAAGDGAPEPETDPLAEPVVQPDPAAPQEPADVAGPATAPDASGDPVPLRQEATAPDAPASGDAAPTAETAPTARPVEAEEPAAPQSPEATDRAELAAPPERGAVAADPGTPPAAPQAEAAPSVSTESAAPPDAGEEAAVSRFALSAESGGGLPGRPATTPGASAEDAPVAAMAEEALDAGALARFGTEFERDGRPLLAVVLIDAGALPGGAAALGGLPIPVTIVVDPTRPDAAAAAESYRAAGLEVGLLSPVPRNATPQDVEVALAAARAAVPEAVVLVDAGDGGLAGDPQAMARAVVTLEEAGMGLVTVSSGFNAGLRAAEAAGVPAALFSRVLDRDAGDAAAVRRALDQAAFRARQDGGAAVMARLTPDTLSALILWGTAAREGQVQPAPVSALLLEAAPE
ncbi:divergent polysaccharide deacetylase family protein [Histidinibacterium lentulum]|uniref:Divergent polysaccharide deacetylase family protein n=1 Tax=Histidinibacterium lentulum TaxID=2480588 RepID=A0A3N2QL10_9RHOB|nr:divergent polysaccharide deacetylase family protein [Histidinibacterium lentulum]ROT95863.1 hypothetical protein EAT49_19580 [Histidinibacterium lentulum]